MNQTHEQHRQETIQHIRKLIDGIQIAMLTTTTETQALRSRPMITARHEFDGDLWFFTALDDPKVGEIQRHAEVNIAYASPDHDRYLSLSGRAEIVHDRKRMETLWHENLQEWFPHGIEQEGLALLRIDVTEAEYWNHKAGRLGGFVKTMLGGEKQAAGDHDKIKWDESVTMT